MFCLCLCCCLHAATTSLFVCVPQRMQVSSSFSLENLRLAVRKMKEHLPEIISLSTIWPPGLPVSSAPSSSHHSVVPQAPQWWGWRRGDVLPQGASLWGAAGGRQTHCQHTAKYFDWILFHVFELN